MPPIEQPKNDTKLLLAVAGLVVAGAAGIALLAGLTLQRQEAAKAEASKPVFDGRASLAAPADTPPGEIGPPAVPASYAVSETSEEPTASDSDATTAEPFVIEPGADLVAGGVAAYGAREFDRAAAYFEAEIAERPARAWTQYMLGLSLWKAGRAERAEAALEQAAKLDPASVKTLVNLSRVRNDLGDFEGALEAARAALVEEPDDATAHMLEGRSLMNLGRAEEAERALEASIAEDEGNGYAHNLLGLLRLRAGRAEDAVGAFERAAELEPGVAFVHNNLGMALELSGRRDEALEAYRASVAADPSHAKAVANLARLGGEAPTVPDAAVEQAATAAPEVAEPAPVVEVASSSSDTTP